MSWQAQAWAWSVPDLSANERLVALNLANRADEYGDYIYPGMNRVSRETGLSESSVRRSINALIEAGHLFIVRRPEGRGNTTEYRMPVEMDAVARKFNAEKGVKTERVSKIKGASVEEKGVTVTEKGCQGDTPTLIEPISKPFRENARENAPHYLPENWRPSVEDAAYASGLGVDPERLALDFTAYWFNANGERARKKNWSLTWQTWCRKEADRGASGLTLANGHNGHAAVRIAANAPPDAWKPLADKFSADGAGIMRPEVEGCFIDLYAQSICEIAGFDPNEPRSDWHVMVEWAREGLFSEKSAVWNEYLEPELKKLCSRPGYKTPGGLAYFSKPLRENWR